MGDNNWKFDLEDLNAENAESGTNSSSSSSSSGAGIGLATALWLLPMGMAGVYTFLEKAAALAAIEGLFGAGGFALTITNALWVCGAIITGMIAVLAVLTVFALLVGIIRRSWLEIVLGLVGVVYFAVGALGATFLFGGVPLLVGLLLTTNLVLYGGIVVIMLVGGFSGILLA